MVDNKPNERSFIKSVRDYFREYCNCTSIHGFRYFGEKRTYLERGWWLAVFCLVLAGCIVAIREVYLKWLNSPVIVSFATKETPIYSIPFPSVTICPETKSQQSLYNHSIILRKQLLNQELTDEEKYHVNGVGMLCDDTGVTLNYTEINSTSEVFYEKLNQVKPSYPLDTCRYMGDDFDCDELFKPTMTDEGICYTFNMLDRTEVFTDIVSYYKDFFKFDKLSNNSWSQENGYLENAGLNTYPRRVSLAGARNALEVHLQQHKGDLDINCKSGLQGYRVTLHTPMRLPRPSQEYFTVPLDEVVLAYIKPNMIATSDSVRMYDSSRRECYFDNERKLKYFKIYTALNCKLECLTKYTLYYCGCVNYFMPRDNETNICGTADIGCMEEAEKNLELGNLKRELSAKKKGKSKAKKKKTTVTEADLLRCDCMPMCNDLTYTVETSQTPYKWFDVLKTFNSSQIPILFDKHEYHISKLVLFFPSARFITSQRHELYGPTDFLANFGGLLGLFTGFSILSLMEIIYFLSIRLCCNTRMYGYWAGENK